MTEATRRNDSSLKTSCANTTCCRQRTFAMHCSNTLSNETIVCDKLARKIVLTIRQFLSSSGIDENKARLPFFSLDYSFAIENPQAIMEPLREQKEDRGNQFESPGSGLL